MSNVGKRCNLVVEANGVVVVKTIANLRKANKQWEATTTRGEHFIAEEMPQDHKLSNYGGYIAVEEI